MNILDQEVILELFRENYELFVLLVFSLTFSLTFYLIPKVLWVSKEKNLMAGVNERSSHSVAVPNFGGVAFYITIVLVLSVLQSMRLTYVGNHLIAAITVLFMVGLKDDLVISTARVKLFGQITAALFLIFSPELQLNNLHGFLGFSEIPEIAGYFLKGFIVVALINSFNLIDGIDGLAAIVGIVISVAYTAIFYVTGQPYFVLVSISLAGTLGAFLRFNFSRGKRKIFMGDSGSLIVGLVLAFLSLKFLAMEPIVPLKSLGYSPANRLLFLACILFLPVFDTLRVIIIRKMNGLSAFSPDRNHVHHVLIDLGLSHKKASFSLGLLNLVIIGVYYSLSNILSHAWLLFLVVLLYSVVFALFGWLKVLGSKSAKESIVGSR
ncbi:MraY family glycosyltransferase [Salinimicrobium sp. HB62]|uniref:MraY family glycosyltransferase n=1 Tax=Salinimicrobium sp. HB62 TaxID=3077781 RepID=UPI002D78B992|nr:MraY family glycosyltransferase [Salinimicrobium sp. HB62]